MNASAANTSLTNTDILLESGTNELEVLVFDLSGHPYGVNVAKVREIIPAPEFSYCPNQPKSVLGVINLRQKVLPLIDLHNCLEIEPPSKETAASSSVIVMEFNKQQSAFRVDCVDQIFRSSWTSIYPIPDVNGIRNTLSTGIIDLNGRLVPMLDFETIYSLVSTGMRHEVPKFEATRDIDRQNRHVVIAEDSNFSRSAMITILEKGGYGKISAFPNGQLAWDSLLKMANEGDLPNVIVSDIEMPLLDGLTLTRQIKENPALRHIPVVLFSSVITPDTLHKGKQVGADEQAAKPQLSELGQLVDKWCDKHSESRPVPIAKTA